MTALNFKVFKVLQAHERRWARDSGSEKKAVHWLTVKRPLSDFR